MAFSLAGFLLIITFVLLIITTVLTFLSLGSVTGPQADDIKGFLAISVGCTILAMILVIVAVVLAILEYRRTDKKAKNIEIIFIIFLFLILLLLLVAGLLAFYSTLKLYCFGETNTDAFTYALWVTMISLVSFIVIFGLLIGKLVTDELKKYWLKKNCAQTKAELASDEAKQFR